MDAERPDGRAGVLLADPLAVRVSLGPQGAREPEADQRLDRRPVAQLPRLLVARGRKIQGGGELVFGDPLRELVIAFAEAEGAEEVLLERQAEHAGHPEAALLPYAEYERMRPKLKDFPLTHGQVVQAQDEVNPDQIGIWGTSNGGAHVVYTAGIDERVKCAVGQVGFGDGWRLVEHNAGSLPTPVMSDESVTPMLASGISIFVQVLAGSGSRRTLEPVPAQLYTAEAVSRCPPTAPPLAQNVSVR